MKYQVSRCLASHHITQSIIGMTKATLSPPVSRIQRVAWPPTSRSKPLSTVRCSAATSTLTITKPDDWHLHLRDGESILSSVVPHSASVFGRSIIMPNLVPPVTTSAMAMAYKQRIEQAVPEARAGTFTPLMTMYLTDNTSPEDVREAKERGVVAFKMYPAGATTNSDSGVTDWKKCVETLKAMEEVDMPLLVHGEVTDSSIDFFDREAVFIERILTPLLDTLPNLRVVMEHITTKQAAEFVARAPKNVAASITPQHILWNRNSLFVGGLRPHAFCLPILKRETHREAVADAAMSNTGKFFLGTDSAPHPKGAKESACGCAGIFSAPVALPLYAHAFEQAGKLDALESFASFNGPDFYKLPRNTGTVTLVKEAWTVPESYAFGEDVVIPMWSGLECPWRVVEK